MPALVVIPTYNEAANIDRLLRAVRAATAAHVLVVDDASPDGTADLAVRAAEAIAGCTVLRRPAKLGLGSAYRDGFRWGLDRGYEALVEMDADFSHDPRVIESLLEPLTTGADLVIGSRYVPGGSITQWTAGRRALSRWGNRYASAALAIDVTDATSGFRAYRADILDRIDLDTVGADGYGFQIEMAYRVSRAGGRVVEIPIRFDDRAAGRTKMSRRIIVEALVLVTFWGVRDRVGTLRARTRRETPASRR